MLLPLLSGSKKARNLFKKWYGPEATAMKGLIVATGMLGGAGAAGAGGAGAGAAGAGGASAGGSGTAGASTGGLMGILGNFGKQAGKYVGQQALSQAVQPEPPSQPIYAPPSQMNLNLLNNLNRNYRMQGQRKFFS